MKENRHGMIRFRIFGIFHKHFVWRLLNYNPEKEKNSLLNFTSTFHIYICKCTSKVCVNKLVFTTYMSFEQKEICIYICTKLGFLLGGGGGVTVTWWGLKKSDTLKGRLWGVTFLGMGLSDILLLFAHKRNKRSIWTEVFLLSAPKMWVNGVIMTMR